MRWRSVGVQRDAHNIRPQLFKPSREPRTFKTGVTCDNYPRIFKNSFKFFIFIFFFLKKLMSPKMAYQDFITRSWS